jgi:hypothetical protein
MTLLGTLQHSPAVKLEKQHSLTAETKTIVAQHRIKHASLWKVRPSVDIVAPHS